MHFQSSPETKGYTRRSEGHDNNTLSPTRWSPYCLPPCWERFLGTGGVACAPPFYYNLNSHICPNHNKTPK